MNKRRKRIIKGILYALLSVSSIILLILGWTYLASKRPELFPSPKETWDRLLLFLRKPIRNIPLYIHVLDSLRRVGIAVLSACGLGILFGTALGWSRFVKSTFGTLFELIRPIPPIAWVPLLTIWFGIGEFPKILLVFIGTFAIIVVNTAAGIKMVEPLNLAVGKIYQARNFQMLKEIVLPASLPAIFAGIRTAMGVGWAIVLAAEMLGAVSGTGFLITKGMEVGDTPLIFICMFIIGIIGALLSALASFIERRVCPWRTNKQN